MATVKFIINKNKKKNNKHSVYLQLTHKRVPTTIATKIDVYKEEWVTDLGRIRKIKNGSNNIVKLNNRLDKLKTKAYEIICKLEDENKLHNMNIKNLRELITGKEDFTTVFKFWKTWVINKNFTSTSTLKAYKYALKSFEKFTKHKDLRFEDIDYRFLKKYEQWSCRIGNKTNGYGTHLRILKAIYNEAIKNKIVSRDYYPFLDYKIRKETPLKRSLTLTELKRIKKIDLTNHKYLIETRNIFLISFFAGGIPFIDLVKLNKRNIVDNEIRYRRTKTGAEIKIPINEELKLLLKPYINNNNYLFHFIENDDFFKHSKKYDNAIISYNNKLKKLGELCNLNIKLSSYVARHTFATLSVNHFKLPLSLVQKSLGHADIKTTQNYLSSFSKEERMNEFSSLRFD